jgi:hypothetical protein
MEEIKIKEYEMNRIIPVLVSIAARNLIKSS